MHEEEAEHQSTGHPWESEALVCGLGEPGWWLKGPGAWIILGWDWGQGMVDND